MWSEGWSTSQETMNFKVLISAPPMTSWPHARGKSKPLGLGVCSSAQHLPLEEASEDCSVAFSALKTPSAIVPTCMSWSFTLVLKHCSVLWAWPSCQKTQQVCTVSLSVTPTPGQADRCKNCVSSSHLSLNSQRPQASWDRSHEACHGTLCGHRNLVKITDQQVEWVVLETGHLSPKQI